MDLRGELANSDITKGRVMITEDRGQTDREFNYRGHSYPLWIVGVSGLIIYYILKLYFMVSRGREGE